MPVRPLPSDPSLEHLRKQARRLLRRARAGDAGAVALIREWHPRADAALAAPSLADAQIAIARSHGFRAWADLKRHLAAIAPHVFSPPAAPPGQEPLADAFLRLACLDYERWQPADAAAASRLLAAHPDLAGASVHTAAAAGDVERVAAFLRDDPAQAQARGGPYGWEPLLYACYSRLDEPGRSTLEAARRLLAHGADPNAGFLWHGLLPPFTALTGAFGSGENARRQPAHPRAVALARLLLEAGADPNDGQALYNRHFDADDRHLELLLAHGLGRDRGGPWMTRFRGRLEEPAQLLAEELWSAARKNYPARAALLVAHGADVDRPGRRDGRTPYQAAVRAGHLDLAAYLAAHGARVTPQAPREAFEAACIAGRGDEARRLLDEHPGLLDEIGAHGRIELLHRAVESDRPEGLRLMAGLGFEVSGTTWHDNVGVNLAATPLHNAAWAGKLHLVRLLLELGADPTVRDPTYRATPRGWAAYNQQHETADCLMAVTDIFDAVEGGGVERVAALLDADPSLAQARDAEGRPPAFYLRDGTPRRDALVALLAAHGAQ